MLDPANVLIACKSPDNPASASNPFVARCCAAFVATFRAVFAESGKTTDNPAWPAEQAAVAAYLAALPPLSGVENIREFVACVSHGMALEIIDGRDGARLLYAAQVAGSLMDKSIKPEVSVLRTPKPTAA